MPEHSLIGIVMATMVEAEPFVKGLYLVEAERKPFRVFRNDRYVLIISGIGKANAAMATAYCCLRLSPYCVLNLGAAGATDRTRALGETWHISKTFEYDRPLFGSGSPHVYIPDILDGFSTTTVSTQDTVVMEPERRKQVSEIAGLVDMEGASVVHACRRFGIKSYLFKFVSDTPKDIDDRIIEDNIRKYRSMFYDFISTHVFSIL